METHPVVESLLRERSPPHREPARRARARVRGRVRRRRCSPRSAAMLAFGPETRPRGRLDRASRSSSLCALAGRVRFSVGRRQHDGRAARARPDARCCCRRRSCRCSSRWPSRCAACPSTSAAQAHPDRVAPPPLRRVVRWSRPALVIAYAAPGPPRSTTGRSTSPPSRAQLASDAAISVVRQWAAYGVAPGAPAARDGDRRTRSTRPRADRPDDGDPRVRRAASPSSSPSRCSRSWRCSPTSARSASSTRSRSATPTAAARCSWARCSRPTTPYTGGEHSKGVVGARARRRPQLGLDARRAARPRVRRAAARHRQAQDAAEILNKPGKLTPEEWEIIKRHPEDGQRMLERIGGVARRGRPDGPRPPRALGRRRLPRRPRRRGDPAQRAHHLRLRRLQRDDDEPLYREAMPRRRTRSPSCARCPGPVRRARRRRRSRRSSPLELPVPLATPCVDWVACSARADRSSSSGSSGSASAQARAGSSSCSCSSGGCRARSRTRSAARAPRPT